MLLTPEAVTAEQHTTLCSLSLFVLLSPPCPALAPLPQRRSPQKPSQPISKKASRSLRVNAWMSGSADMPCFLKARSPNARDTSTRPACG